MLLNLQMQTTKPYHPAGYQDTGLFIYLYFEGDFIQIRQFYLLP